jgi:hypothetical protein
MGDARTLRAAFHFKFLGGLWYTNGEYGFSWLVMGIAFHK